MKRPLRILTIGHSYCVAMNRGIVREVARDSNFEITVAAPKFFYGDLRPIAIEPEPAGSPLKVVGLATTLSRYIHVFRYDGSALRELLRSGDFDVVHAWEEPLHCSRLSDCAGITERQCQILFPNRPELREALSAAIWIFRAHRTRSCSGVDRGCEPGLQGHA